MKYINYANTDTDFEAYLDQFVQDDYDYESREYELRYELTKENR